MAEPTVVTLDVREMPPRQRHPEIFSRLDAGKRGDVLRLVNDHDPAPLRYQLLAEHPGTFAWEPEQQGPQEWIIRIHKVAEEE